MSYLPDEEFYSIYNKVPRLAVDVLLEGEEGVLLSRRSIEPCLGCWHLPGGTVYKDETVEEAAIRIAKKETGLSIIPKNSIGHTEFPNEIRNNVNIHTISIIVSAEIKGGTLQVDKDASEVNWFKKLPENLIAQHKVFLEHHLKAS
jgi:colanic acid biosynthesis protein WcaH